MDIPWDDARLYLAVVEAGSLSGAARKLRMTQPTVSRRLAELEELLGEPLFDRTAGGTTLTEYGARLVEPARHMAHFAGELARVAEQKDESSGIVRITASPGVAHGFLLPFAATLAEEFPKIQLHVVSSVRPLDLARREADIALRLGGAEEPDCVANIALDLGPYAAERYAASVKSTRDPAALSWIGWAPPFDDLSPNSILRRLVPGFRLGFASDDYLVQMRACELGLGAMLIAHEHPRLGSRTTLRPLDVDLPPVRRTLSLLCPRSAYAIPRVRTVVEPLAEALREWDAAGTPR
jgi:molybdate transport repressor ModE-like protein